MAEPAAKTWQRIMAEQLTELSKETAPEPEFFEVILQAAGEMKAVALKVALARCLETIRNSRVNEGVVDSSVEWEGKLWELVK